MDIFERCHRINDLVVNEKESEAKDLLIKLLDYHKKRKIEYSPLVNHLIRQVGLYPYIQTETAHWQDRFVYECFKTDVGSSTKPTLHREQSRVLKRLIEGDNLAVSAPTSFGKSFVIDSFIATKKPRNVVIIVPTIALTDETRRRLQSKFSDEYKIITTPGVELSERNILIFPQERAINYAEQIDELDMLVIDEFYKASADFDKERSASLIKAIMKFGAKAKQRYFLAPNISSLKSNPFTSGMEFLHLEFNTVFLKQYELYRGIDKGDAKKSDVLLKVLKKWPGKTLIYAGTYTEVRKLVELITNADLGKESRKLEAFSEWLETNYSKDWNLPKLVKAGTGIHNGQLHRCLGQIQIKLFEEVNGLDRMVSTSSIIEGVNTSAENVVVWRNRIGGSALNDFTYKNIIGRGGRMLKHFVGRVFILEEPPLEADTQLSLSFPDEILGDVDEERYKKELTKEQLSKIIEYREEMTKLLGEEAYKEIQNADSIQSTNGELIRIIAASMRNNPNEWRGLGYLNSSDPDEWTRWLYKIIRLSPAGWDARYSKVVEFTKVLSDNWVLTIPELLDALQNYEVDINEFFQLERKVTFKLASLLGDVSLIYSKVFPEKTDNISEFAAKVSHAFLPKLVYEFEEYGLPRMLSRKIQKAGLFNFEAAEQSLHQAIIVFNDIGWRRVFSEVGDLTRFDAYVLQYFFQGIAAPQR